MFSRPGTYPPVGMFTVTHIVAVIMCFVLIAVAVVLTRKMKRETYFRLLKIFAIVFTCLELFKIIWSLSMGETRLNNWLPLYFCSLFIYALWFTWSKSELRIFGLSFIALAGIVAGSIFIITPTTSFQSYPIFHFQSLYSMLYHSTMVYTGIMFYLTKASIVDKKLLVNYIIFCVSFMTLALIVNSFAGSNLMFVSDPGNIPLPFLDDIYAFSHALYSILIYIAHVSIGLIVFGIYKLANRKKQATRVENDGVGNILDKLDEDIDEEEKKRI